MKLDKQRRPAPFFTLRVLSFDPFPRGAGRVLPGGLPSHRTIQAWEDSCDGLATSLNQIMYNRVLAIPGTTPWMP